MLKACVDKKPKKEANLFFSETHINIDKAREKGKDLYQNRIYIIYYILLLLFFISINISLKKEKSKITNINSYIDYYYESYDIRKLGLKYERNNSDIMIFKFPDNNLNHLKSFYSNQFTYKYCVIEFIHHFFLYKDSFHNKNIFYLLSYLENDLFYRNSSRVKYIYYKPNYLQNMNISVVTNESKIFSSFKACLNEVILEKYILCLTFNLILITIKIIYNKERKEAKIKLIPEEESKIKIDLNINDFDEVENRLSQKSNLKDKTYYNDNNIRIGSNKKNNILRNINHYIQNKIIIKIIILMKIFQVLPYNKNIYFKFHFSNITLKIKGTGIKKIFSSDTEHFKNNYYPDIVYVNGNMCDTITPKYDFTQEDNVVQLIWNNTIDDCEHMFYLCTDIIEIDLSNFDASNCKYMWSMFNSCYKLTSINFSNFNTSKNEIFLDMFYNCSSLTSLNLSTFNTSKLR